jgi:glutamyl-tRNA(Gln) amidotransferase subunit D
MNEEKLQGYRGILRKKLEESNVKIGDVLEVETTGTKYYGTLMPRVETADERHIVLKLRSGYNIGIAYVDKLMLKKIGEAEKPEFRPPPIPQMKKNLSKVSIVSTGGTIASRVDYITGGVYSAISSRDLLSIVPEISEIAIIEADILYSVFSENITHVHWKEMAKTVSKKINEGAEGVVITHGTDTMAYSSAALSFALQDLPVPVIFVGSQRSSDRPSSDAATNLVGVVSAAANAPFAEVVIGMHENTSDESIIFHRGTKTRKCHTSSRYAFESINQSPLARYQNSNIEMIEKNYRKRQKTELKIHENFDGRVALIKFHPNFNPKMLEMLIDEGYKGIVLEGTGLGHINEKCYSALDSAIEHGVILGMTSQCIWGRVNMNIYSNGRELQRRGIIPLEDILPETAFVKMMWCLGQTNDRTKVINLLKKNIAGEYTERTVFGERFH